MQLPELYHYGRERYWFGIRTFSVYMIDAVYQVRNAMTTTVYFLICVSQSAVIFFLFLYAYFMPTSRPDGYDVAQYEFSTVRSLARLIPLYITET